MIHPTAIISSSAKIHDNVEIGPYSIIHDNVEIGLGCKIGAYCELGLLTGLSKSDSLVIGSNSIIRSHSVIYIGSDIGDYFQSGHHICVRENSVIGEGVQLGSRGDIQGDCIIGDYVKMHADVHVGKNSKIGSFVWLFPEVLLTNDAMPPSEELIGPEIGDYTVIASKATLLPGVKIGNNCVIGAGSIVKENIPNGKLATGSPAKIICEAKILRMPNNPKIKAYPWRFRFHRGYPIHIVENWIQEAKK